MATAFTQLRERSSTEETVVADEDKQSLLDALHDADCRTILKAVNDEALSASELSEACDLPLSTTYRKLDVLNDAGLLEERTRIQRSAKHTSEYTAAVDDVMISMEGDGGIELTVSRRDTSGRSAVRLGGD